jgi:CheY-specific phosphatase CheX
MRSTPKASSRPGFDTRGTALLYSAVHQQILATFVEAVRQVFQDTDIAIEAVESGDAFGYGAEVITSVGLTGDVRGILMLRTDTAGAEGILKAMSGTVRLPVTNDRLTEMEMAAIGEISNQIAGRAISLLASLDLHCDITPPTVIAAPQLQTLVPDLAESFRQTIRGPFGRLTVFLGISRLG